MTTQNYNHCNSSILKFHFFSPVTVLTILKFNFIPVMVLSTLKLNFNCCVIYPKFQLESLNVIKCNARNEFWDSHCRDYNKCWNVTQ